RAAGVARALRLDRSVGPESPGTLMRSKTDRELTTAATSTACWGIDERCKRFVGQAFAPSMMHHAACVGMIRVRRHPAAAYRSRNSTSARWRPPVHTSMLTSFAAAPRLAGEPSTCGGGPPPPLHNLA